MPVALTTMDIGSSNGSYNFSGDIAVVGAWPAAATVAQLQALTT
jgi:hypothetical protein